MIEVIHIDKVISELADKRISKSHRRKQELVLCEAFQEIIDEKITEHNKEEIKKWKKKDPEPKPLHISYGKASGIKPFDLEESREIEKSSLEEPKEEVAVKKPYKRCCVIL